MEILLRENWENWEHVLKTVLGKIGGMPLEEVTRIVIEPNLLKIEDKTKGFR